MTLELLCASDDGTELSVYPRPYGGAPVGVAVDDSAVYLTEEQAIELIQYLEYLITGDTHGD